MHELSIARSLVRVAEEAAQEAGAVKVTALYLRLGALAGVVRESLEFAYDFATDGTLLEGSKLVIEPVDILCRCESCDRNVRPDSSTKIRCPECDAPTPNILEGRELLVRAIDYDEVGAVPARS